MLYGKDTRELLCVVSLVLKKKIVTAYLVYCNTVF